MLVFVGLPGRIRTYDPMIKSHLLCQLSYGEKTAAKIKIKIDRREEKGERREEK